MRFEVMFVEGGGIIRRFVQHYKSSHRIPFDFGDLAQHPRHPLQSDFEHGGSIALKSFPVLLGRHVFDQNVPNGVAHISALLEQDSALLRRHAEQAFPGSIPA